MTLPNFFNLDATQSPNCMNVVFNPGGSIEKRLGSSSMNTTLLASTTALKLRPAMSRLTNWTCAPGTGTPLPNWLRGLSALMTL